MIERKRVLCISDSLGLPRPGVRYQDTWLSMLSGVLSEIDFIALFRRNGTTDMLSDWDYGECLLFYRPNQVVLQLGICDCSPRYLRTTSIVYRILNKLPQLFSSIAWRFIKLFVGRSAKRTDVSQKRFADNIKAYLDRCVESGVERVVIILIATPAPKMTTSNPKVVENVNLYNSIYRDIAQRYAFVELINPLSIADDSFYVDGYHPCAKGNTVIYESLYELYK